MVIAVIGTTALYLLFAWLISAIVASYLSGRKGYGERTGLAFGLILAVIGVVIWLIVPARKNSDWKVLGPFGRPKVDRKPPAQSPAAPPGPGGPQAPEGPGAATGTS